MIYQKQQAKTLADFAEHIAGVISGELSFESLIVYDESSAQNVIESASDYLIAKDQGILGIWTDSTGDNFYHGAGFLNSVEHSAEMESASYSGSITVTGSITKGTRS